MKSTRERARKVRRARVDTIKPASLTHNLYYAASRVQLQVAAAVQSRIVTLLHLCVVKHISFFRAC